MSTSKTVAAVDLGAESGRVVGVRLDQRSVTEQVVHRFDNVPVQRDGALRWDIDTLLREIRCGLDLLGADGPVASVGVDTWGLDYGLVDAAGELVDLPISYRDGRTRDVFEQAIREHGASTFYQGSGIQLLEVNSIFQWLADVRRPDHRLDRAAQALLMPDVFHHLLGGDVVTEYTAASTTGAYDVAASVWATDLLEQVGLPTHMLPDVVPSGADVGALATGPDSPAGLRGTRIVVPAAHDTASAVVAVPFTAPDAMFVSSGTWSLVGVERTSPVIDAASQRANLTNEGGYDGTIRLLRNVMGLWLLQECRRQWRREGRDFEYADLVQQAGEQDAEQDGGRSLVDPDHPDFLTPGDMPTRIREHCAASGQPVPETPGEVSRCVIDSLALGYNAVADDLEPILGRRPSAVHIVGGGARNTLLSQLAADVTGLPVHCGPFEATALGNGLVQLAALGEVKGLDQIRDLIRSSTDVLTYEPRDTERWAHARARFRDIRSQTTSMATGPAPGPNQHQHRRK
ncbi:MAG: rhamnulokinase [Propionibacteriales bacterium]|nr:rhamnulokinase [Propionibacteriales bacterium]